MQMEAEYRANVNRVYEEVKKRLVGSLYSCLIALITMIDLIDKYIETLSVRR